MGNMQMNRHTAILLVVGSLVGVVGLVSFKLATADPGKAVIRALDEAKEKVLQIGAGVSVKELEHPDPQNPSQDKEWMRVTIFGQEMRIPRDSKGIRVSELSPDKKRILVFCIRDRSFEFTRYFEAEPEIMDRDRAVLLDMGPGTKKFELLVSALISAGQSTANAKKIVSDAWNALGALSSEDLLVRFLGCDRDNLARELQPEKAAEEGLLYILRGGLKPGWAFRFKVGKETVYAVHCPSSQVSGWLIHAYNRKGQKTWRGTYAVYLPSKLKNNLDALKQILVVGEEDGEEPQEEASTKPRPTTQPAKE